MALLRLLASYHPWTIQLGEERWLVVARAEDDEAGSGALELVDHWAQERGHVGMIPMLGLDALHLPERLEEAR